MAIRWTSEVQELVISTTFYWAGDGFGARLAAKHLEIIYTYPKKKKIFCRWKKNIKKKEKARISIIWCCGERIKTQKKIKIKNQHIKSGVREEGKRLECSIYTTVLKCKYIIIWFVYRGCIIHFS